MEKMEGDGIKFIKEYKNKTDINLYSKYINNAFDNLIQGLQLLFKNNLYFSDIKPSNISYTNYNNKLIFKWIDLECISKSYNDSCITYTYFDPYNIQVLFEKNSNIKLLQSSDLYKVGLSILTMLDGVNPIEELDNNMSNLQLMLYIYNNENTTIEKNK